MEVRKSIQRNAENYLIMECQDDDLSPAQIIAYEKKEEAYMTASKNLQVFVDNGNVLYENSSMMVFTLKNNTSASQQLQIIPDKNNVNNCVGETKSYDGHFMTPDVCLNVTQSKVTINSLKKLVCNSEFKVRKYIFNLPSNNIPESKAFKEKTYQLVINKTLGIIPNENKKYNTLPDNFCKSFTTDINANAKSVTLPSVASTSKNHITKTSSRFSALKENNLVTQSNLAVVPSLELKDDNEVEIPFNNRKIFPSLLIVTRPCLFTKNITRSIINEENLYLNEKVKLILRLSESMFVEWLLKQGIIKSEQYCTNHGNTERNEFKMKLGLYSDKTKFLNSGGYVWISDCCQTNFTSIFKRSIFEGMPCAPKELLKLVYHWACQTNINNVIEWLTMNTTFLKKFYTAFRAVCIAAVHEEYKCLLGGNNKMVEVGVVSLGTLSEGKVKKTKAWILGAMESDTKFLRLQVVDPISHSEPNTLQLKKLLQPLSKFVHKDSRILTDLTFNKEVFLSMGYKNIVQKPTKINVNKIIHSSNDIMDYFNECIPRIFKNSLSLLSMQVIQQVLDELAWRERWGQTASRAFHSMISHIEKQTKIERSGTLYSCLLKIAANPSMDWQYKNWKTNLKVLDEKLQGETYKLSKNIPVAKKLHTDIKIQNNQNEGKLFNKNIVSDLSAPLFTIAANGKIVPQDLKKLENYYYGQLDGNKNLLDQETKCYLQMKCVLCSNTMNTNISMMKHLITHALSVYTNTVENSRWCKYCLQQFTNDENLIKHVHETHFKTIKPTLTCLICEKDFKYRTKLILHMHCSHNEVEMPYECTICKFRSSQHRHVIDHFYEKHNNSGKAQCPLCLKVVAFKDNGKKITQNIYFFLNHIKKHTCKKLVKKCNRCVLSFINKSVLEYHQRVHHITCKYIPNVKRQDTFYTVLMPVPFIGPVGEKYENNKIPEKYNNFYACEKLSLKININKSGQNVCCECEGFIEEDDHFPGNLSCNKCLYKTCCEKSMVEHIVKFHDSGSKHILNIGRKTILNKPMHCLCGFKSLSGDKLARHAVLCKKKSVYPLKRAVRNNENANISGSTEKMFKYEPERQVENGCMNTLNNNSKISDVLQSSGLEMNTTTKNQSDNDTDKNSSRLKREINTPETSTEYSDNNCKPPEKKIKIEQ